MNRPVIIIGAGDHARVLLDILLEQGDEVIGLSDKSVPKGTVVYGVPVIGDDSEVLKYSFDEVELVNGIGSVGSTVLRAGAFRSFKEKGYDFVSVIHPSAVISRMAELREGVQVLAGAVVGPGAVLGEDCIINTNASVDHGCTIGKHCHIAPGCTLSGCVTVGEGTHIGTGSSVIQGIKIGANVLIGAGSVVIRNIEDNSMVYGVPAKMTDTRNVMGGGNFSYLKLPSDWNVA